MHVAGRVEDGPRAVVAQRPTRSALDLCRAARLRGRGGSRLYRRAATLLRLGRADDAKPLVQSAQERLSRQPVGSPYAAQALGLRELAS